MIPIHNNHRQFLRFSTILDNYQFNCLPFGLSCISWVFTKTLKPVLTLLRELGIRLVAYIDDILVIAETVELATDHTSDVIEFLGMMVDSRGMELSLPGQKIKKLRQKVGKIRDQLTSPTAC